MPSATNQKFVTEFTDEIKSSEHVLVTQYQGLTTEELNELRSKLKPFGTRYKIVKNRLARIVLKNIGWDGLDGHLKGPTALAYKGTDVAGITKVLFKFSEDHKNLKVRGGHAFGSAIDSASLKSIASLPGRNVLLATLLARLQSPLQTLVGTLQEPVRSLHAALTQVAKKKEATPAA